MIHELAIHFVAAASPWVDAQHQGLIGAVFGGGVGLLGAIYGALLGTLVPRARGRAVVFGVHWGFLALGVVMLAAGITALVTGQPYGVWYGLLLPGTLATTMLAIFTPVLGRIWYRQAEARRLEAEEFRRG